MATDTAAISIELSDGEVIGRTRAMASDITVRAPADRQAGEAVRTGVAVALDVFSEVQAVCTRFDPESPLMQCNARPAAWHRVPAVLVDAVTEARRAYEATGGRFDPRIYTELVGLGYDRTLPFSAGDVVVAAADAAAPAGRREYWAPGIRSESCEINLGGAPIDLGGIGKGLAVRWAAERLGRHTPNFLIEAGGDCHCAGVGPAGETWRLGVEDPAGGSEPLAVVALIDRACTTSSIRVRHWVAGGQRAHHIIDPRTGRPGGEGMVAVTVIGADAATSEVWSKSLFLSGAEAIGAEAERRGLAVLWVEENGRLGVSSAARAHVIWERPCG